jgi:dipeptidyl-peptidase-4
MRNAALVLLSIAVLFLPASGAETLEHIASQALASQPAVSISPLGRFVAIQEGRSIRLEETATGRSRIVFGRVMLTPEVSWSPDDRYLFVIDAGRVTAYETRQGGIHASFSGSSPISHLEVSPDGRFCAFIRDHNLWMASVNLQDPKPLTQAGNANVLVGVPDFVYAQEFGVKRHYWWAPNSSAIAFIETEFSTSEHYVEASAKLPVFRLKIVDITTGQMHVVSESSEQWPYLFRPAWHPDSKRIAFYRMNRLQNTAELCVVENNALRTVLVEQDQYWLNAPETPLFVEEGKRLVVSSERSGGRHIYLYELAGELVRDLTPPGLEVYQLHGQVDARGGVYVSGSTGTMQERQLYELNIGGGPPNQVTRTEGWHDVRLDESGDAYLDSYSTAAKPASIWWHGMGASPREIFHSEITQRPVANDFLAIKMHDGLELPARLYKPDDFDSRKKYRVLLYTFSGPSGRVVMDSWDGWQMAWNRYMVSKEFLVLAVDARGSWGYGHLFEEYIHYRFGAQEVSDLREVVNYLRRQSYVDAGRLGIWGCDYGAHTVVHAMLQFPHGFKAGFADSPIMDWTGYDAYFTERYLGFPKTRREYTDSSALDDVKRMSGTLLVAASANNPVIRSDQFEALQKAMARVKNKDVIERLHLLRLDDVDYRKHAQELARLMESMTEFFEQTL